MAYVSDFDTKTLKIQYSPDIKLSFCLPYTAPNNSGQPNNEKREKSYLEEKRKSRRCQLVRVLKASQRRRQGRRKLENPIDLAFCRFVSEHVLVSNSDWEMVVSSIQVSGSVHVLIMMSMRLLVWSCLLR